MIHQHHHEPQWMPSLLFVTLHDICLQFASLHLPLSMASPPFRPSLAKYLTSASFSISPFGSLFITRLTRVSPTPVFLPTRTKSGHWISFAKDRVTKSLGRSSQAIHRRSSSVHQSEMPFRALQTGGLLHCNGKDLRPLSHLNHLFMMLPLLMKNLVSCLL